MAILSSNIDPALNIPQIGSKSEAWMAWHKSLKSNFGKANANILWVQAWQKRGNPSANTNELRTYMDSQGIKIDSSAWNKITDLGANIGDLWSASMKVGQYTVIAIIIIILGGAGMIIFNLAKQPAESIGLAARAAIKG